MGLVTEKWNLAFRPYSGFRDTRAPYKKIPGDRNGWYADPFLFSRDGKTYLFAEYFSYKTGKGSIVVFGYDRAAGGFSAPREIVSERFHMSYPLVFARGDEIFMLPETAEAEKLLLYRAIKFPDVWVLHSVLADGVTYADTTPIPDTDDAIAYEIQCGAPKACLQIALDHAHEPYNISSKRAIETARPGGKCFYDDGVLTLTAQNCRDAYGGALEFFRYPSFQHVFSVGPDDIRISGERAAIRGVHTYNADAGLEVIDYKTDTVSPIRIAYRAAAKLRERGR